MKKGARCVSTEQIGELRCVPTNRLVFNGGAGHAEVQLAVLFDAGINQSLHGALVLEQQKGIACRKREEAV